MTEEIKLQMLQTWIEARNFARLERVRAENAMLRAAVAGDKFREITLGLPDIFHRHLAAAYDFRLSTAC